MAKAKYVLEVVEYHINKNDNLPMLIHVGYMKGKFKTKKDAVSYYDRYNPHMRSLNAHGTYQSDWDPETKLLYIVREDKEIIDTINPFSEEDLPSDNGMITKYKWLK